MKNLTNKIIIVFTALAAITFISSCKKNSNPGAQKGLLYLHVHTEIDTAEVEVGQVARDSSGRRLSLSVAQFYLSGITLHKADGSSVTLSKAYVLKTMEAEEYYVDSVDAGNYVSISFNVGIDTATNKTLPSSYPASSPLAAQDPDMWFGSASLGYIFMNIQGMADTTSTHTGDVNYPFSYQLGTNDMLKNIVMPNKTIAIVANQVNFVHLNADYGKALTGVDIKANSFASPWTNAWVATRIANNIPRMFEYEE